MSFNTKTIGLLVLLTAIAGVTYVTQKSDVDAAFLANANQNNKLRDGLVGLWSFDGPDVNLSQVTAEIRDGSGQGSHGNWESHASTTVAGKIGQAIQFDGVDDWIDFGDPAPLRVNGDLTIAAWIKTTNTAKDGMMIITQAAGTNNRNYELNIGLGVPEFTHGSGAATQTYVSRSSVADGNWHHVAFTADYPNGTFYVDGKNTHSPTLSFDIIDTSTAPYRVGGVNLDFPETQLEGALDEVRVYNRALSADEIKRLYLMGGGVPNTTMGETSILPTDETNAANFLSAQQATTTKASTLLSLSVYITTAAGNIRMGVYDATGPGGGPGTKLAETNEMTLGVGWNTAKVITPVVLPSGTYWIASLLSDNSAHFRSTPRNSLYYAFTYGALPATYSLTPSVYANTFSLYATLDTDMGPGGTTNVSQNEKLTGGLVGLWSFDGPDMNSNVADRSGQGNHGFLTGQTSTSTVAGKIGEALSFDGVNDYVNLGTGLDNLRPITISTWVKPHETITSTRTIFGSDGSGEGDGYAMSLGGGTNAFRFLVDGTGATNLTKHTSNGLATVGEWQHYLVTWDGTLDAAGARIYKNGEEVTSFQNNISGDGSLPDDSANTKRIGSHNTGLFFPGDIDEVRLYNRILSADEIKRLYLMGASTKVNASQNQKLTDGLVGQWSFDGPDMISNVADRSGQGNNGFLTNMSTTTVEGKIGQALDFDGANDYVTVGDPASGILDFGDTADFTITGWFYRNTNAAQQNLVGKRLSTSAAHVGYLSYVNPNNGQVNLSVSDGTDTYHLGSATLTSKDSWHHFAIVWDDDSAANTEIYINGVDDNAGDTGTIGDIGSLANSVPLTVGTDGNNNGFFDGKIDDVRIYSRTLSPEEIKRLYLMGGGR